jgi:hypothetical protein
VGENFIVSVPAPRDIKQGEPVYVSLFTPHDEDAPTTADMQSRVYFSEDGWSPWENGGDNDSLGKAVQRLMEEAEEGMEEEGSCFDLKVAKITLHWDDGCKYQFRRAVG